MSNQVFSKHEKSPSKSPTASKEIGHGDELLLWRERIKLEFDIDYFDRTNHTIIPMLEVDGVTKEIREWSQIYGISASTIQGRLKGGWDPRYAVSEPVRREYDPDYTGRENDDAIVLRRALHRSYGGLMVKTVGEFVVRCKCCGGEYVAKTMALRAGKFGKCKKCRGIDHNTEYGRLVIQIPKVYIDKLFKMSLDTMEPVTDIVSRIMNEQLGGETAPNLVYNKEQVRQLVSNDPVMYADGKSYIDELNLESMPDEVSLDDILKMIH